MLTTLYLRNRLLFILIFLSLALSSCQTATTQEAEVFDPLIVPMFEETKPIAFRKIVVKIPRNQPIGSVSVGLFCLTSGSLTLSSGRHQLDTERFNDLFREELQSANYEVVGDPDELFGDPELDSAEYFIAGLVHNLQANVCYPNAGFFDYSTSSASVYMELEWQIYDTLKREVVKKMHTKGSSKIEKSTLNGIMVAYDDAFAIAVRNLLSQKDFYKLVRDIEKEQNTNMQNVPAANSNLSKGDVDMSSLVQEIFESSRFGANSNLGYIDMKLLSSTVPVVRTASGHGSGFIVGDGLLLTNQHVVGGAKKVRLIFENGDEIDGKVLATNSIRDVAIVGYTDSSERQPLPIRLSEVGVGESVYSYGAPIDEKFSGTLRKGIVSAHRDLKGMDYIQSDVAVNQGNSGGPLLDEKGYVVGISAWGVVSSAQGQQGLNFFIPIADALNSIAQ